MPSTIVGRRAVARVLVAAAAATVAGSAVPCLTADAAVVPLSRPYGDHIDAPGGGPVRIGNGRHNTSEATINSPVTHRGAQQIAIGLAGASAIQNAICRRGRWRHCRIVQRIRQVHLGSP